MTRNAKILLITPYSNKHRRVETLIPIGLLSIGGFLRQNGYEAKVYNANFVPRDYSKDKLKNTRADEVRFIPYGIEERNFTLMPKAITGKAREVVVNYAPDIIGLGFPTDALDAAINIAKLAKELNKNVIVIVGGIHPTAMPNETLSIPYFDFLVHGEGEFTALELINAIVSGKSPQDIKGVSFKKNSEIITTNPRPEISNLDIIPFDNRDLLIDFEKYPKQALGQIHTSRGCFYNCAYCSSSIIWINKVRFRSVENVLKEILYLYTKYDVRDFNFADDNFTLTPERTKAICQGILEKGFKIKWRCCARADIHQKLDLGLLKYMYKAGCYNICVGFESGSQKILDRAKRGISVDEAAHLIKMMKDAKIKINADFIIGLPGENETTLDETLQLMKKVWDNSHATISVALFKPYPGTSAYQRKESTDYKGLSSKFREIFNYAEKFNIRSLSSNLRYVSNRLSENITSPRQLFSIFRKTLKGWVGKNVG